MNHLLLTLIIILIIGITNIKSFDQTKFHNSYLNNVYYIEHEQKYDWYQSLTQCARMNMSLLTIESQRKSNEVNSLVKYIYGKNIFLWIGGYAVGPSKQFTWISNGELFGFTFWCSGKPDDASGAFCAQFGWYENMEWNNFNCTAKFGYICEYINNKKCTNTDNVSDSYGGRKYNNLAFDF